MARSGDAARGLRCAAGADGLPAMPQARDWLRARFDYPTPRVALGMALRGIASACIDLSDGLLADLPRLAAGQRLRRAMLDVERLPLSAALRELARRCRRGDYALAGGEDYELCFTAPPARAARCWRAGRAAAACRCSRCGRLRAAPGCELQRGGDRDPVLAIAGFDHFSALDRRDPRHGRPGFRDAVSQIAARAFRILDAG